MTKHIKFLGLLLLAGILTVSCTKDEAELIHQEANSTEDVIFIDTYADLNSFLSNSETIVPEQEKIDDQIIHTRSYQSYITTGYTSYKSNGTSKMIFSESVAATLGLKSGAMYLMEFFEVKKEVTVPNSSTHAVFSISCNGLHPDNYSKGFTYSHVGTKLIMTTRVACAISDILGRPLNIWCPVTINNVRWEYGVLQR